MDKINHIQRMQAKIQGVVLFSILFVFLGIPLVEQFLFRVSHFGYSFTGVGEWYIPFMIIIIIGNVALSWGWRHITNKRIKAIVEEFNEKCEYHIKQIKTAENRLLA